MRLQSIVTMVALLLPAAASMCVAQSANPLSAEAKQNYERIKGNVMKAAEKMPEENYSFKATADVRPFGQLVAHVSDSQMRGCSAFKGESKAGDAASKTAKADLMAALKESFAECDSAFDALTDATAAQTVKTPRGERTRLGMAYGIVAHDNEMYGTMSVYMRLKGLVPPSSEK